jgi:hypothetical protein
VIGDALKLKIAFSGHFIDKNHNKKVYILISLQININWVHQLPIHQSPEVSDVPFE